MDEPGKAHRATATRDIGQMLVISVSVLAGLLLAFYLGQITARVQPTALGPDGQPVAAADRSADPGILLDDADRADQVNDLQKQIDVLKKETTELRTEKADLSEKLSIAADAVNRLTRAAQSEKSRADELEWRLRQVESAPRIGPN